MTLNFLKFYFRMLCHLLHLQKYYCLNRWHLNMFFTCLSKLFVIASWIIKKSKKTNKQVFCVGATEGGSLIICSKYQATEKYM